MDTGSFPGVMSGRGVTLTPHPLLVPWSWKTRAIPLLPPMGRTACTEPQCLYKGALYLYLLLYLINATIFEKVTEHKMCLLFFSTTFVWNIFYSKNNWAKCDHTCVLVCMSVTRYSCYISLKLEFRRQIFEKYSNIKFRENPSIRIE